MAARDLKAASIDIKDHTPVITLTFDSMVAGGTVALGFTPFESPIGKSKIVITATYPGFASDGSATTYTRTVYPTKIKRARYPTSASVAAEVGDFAVSGSDYVLRFALADPIYTNCTNVTVTVDAGLYTDGGGASNAATNFTVTNNSTQGYGNVKANYSLPAHGRRMGFNEFTVANDATGYFEVRIVAYAGHSADGNGGIACVKVTATGQTSGVSVTTTGTLTVDKTTHGDAREIPEYIVLIPYAGFTQGELVNIIPKVYPYIGETVFDFSAQGNTMPTGRPCTHVALCDKTHAYGTPVAVVDGGTGVGASCTNLASFNPASPPIAYATVGAACTALMAYNNTNYGHNNLSGCIIYMKAGNYATVGADITNSANTTWLIITPFPGVTRAQVVFNSQSGDYYCAPTFEMRNNVTYAMGAVDLARTNQHYMYYKCDIQSGANFHSSTNPAMCWLIGTTMTNIGQGLMPVITYALGLMLRGLTYTNTTAKTCKADVVIGCSFVGSVTITNTGSTSYGVHHGQVIANNYSQLHTDTYALQIESTTTNGPYVINNIFIQPGDPSVVSSAIIKLFGDDSVIDPGNDIHLVYNTILGERSNFYYNDHNLNGVGPGPRLLCSLKNNLAEMLNTISDVDNHGDVPNTERYGNHAFRHGMWSSGNFTRFLPGQTSMHCEAGAKNLFRESGAQTDVLFVNDKSGRPGAPQTGTGDYHLLTGSPAINQAYEYVFKYDAEGKLRKTTNGSAGAYECAPSGGGNARATIGRFIFHRKELV